MRGKAEEVVEHLCIVCGKVLELQSHESAHRYNQKRFCSSECYREYAKERGLGWFQKDDELYANNEETREEQHIAKVVELAKKTNAVEKRVEEVEKQFFTPKEIIAYLKL